MDRRAGLFGRIYAQTIPAEMKVNIVGSGNVASVIGQHLSQHVKVLSVYARKIEEAERLAQLCQAKSINQLSDLDHNADLTIVAIKDDALKEVVANIPKRLATVHTSGSVGLEVFDGFETFGVLYPLQTFSKGKAVDLKQVPFLIEGCTEEFTHTLLQFSKTNFSSNTLLADADKRRKIHLAAVFACNFITQLFSESEQILKKEEVDLSLLYPLIQETVDKVLTVGPKEALTGPAKRKDHAVIERHLNLLEGPQRAIYELITNRIIESNS